SLLLSLLLLLLMSDGPIQILARQRIVRLQTDGLGGGLNGFVPAFQGAIAGGHIVVGLGITGAALERLLRQRNAACIIAVITGLRRGVGQGRGGAGGRRRGLALFGRGALLEILARGLVVVRQLEAVLHEGVEGLPVFLLGIDLQQQIARKKRPRIRSHGSL